VESLAPTTMPSSILRTTGVVAKRARLRAWRGRECCCWRWFRAPVRAFARQFRTLFRPVYLILADFSDDPPSAIPFIQRFQCCSRLPSIPFWQESVVTPFSNSPRLNCHAPGSPCTRPSAFRPRLSGRPPDGGPILRHRCVSLYKTPETGVPYFYLFWLNGPARFVRYSITDA
jgi:hypothetical protein